MRYYDNNVTLFKLGNYLVHLLLCMTSAVTTYIHGNKQISMSTLTKTVRGRNGDVKLKLK